MTAKLMTMAVRISAWGRGSTRPTAPRIGGFRSLPSARTGDPLMAIMDRLAPWPRANTPMATDFSSRESIR